MISNICTLSARTADGLFVDAVPENTDNMIEKIEKHRSLTTNNDTVIPIANQKISQILKHCVSLAKLQQTQLVFLATDAPNLRQKQQFQKLFERLPCTFTLNDILPPKNSKAWAPMDQYRTQNTGDSMRKFLIPLVDALVASKGNLFIGTKGSTFSGYISRLHQKS